MGLAYHLAEAGWTDVLLIEKAELTSGSTWHAAGQCPSFIGNYNMAKIHHYSNTLYPRLEKLYNFPGRPPDQDALLIAATKIARYRAKAKRQKGTAAMQEIPMEVGNST